MSLILVTALLVAAVGSAGCGGPSSTGGKAPAAPQEPKAAQTPSQKQSQAPTQAPPGAGASWPEWSGPKSLGPGKDLPQAWCVVLTYCYKPGYAYIMRVSSESEWYDDTPRKTTNPLNGKLTPEELNLVRSALAQINWEPLPEKSKDYVAYTAEPKSPAAGVGFVGYIVDYYGGQTHAVPPTKGKRIMADFKVPCAPEMKNLVHVLKPLMDKYIPPK